ncbi:MAG TPA: hypothetical protein PK239_01805, partial [Chitinophagales bacterium]|nr:hypothetical protein [Chitinophagales bacterium]
LQGGGQYLSRYDYFLVNKMVKLSAVYYLALGQKLARCVSEHWVEEKDKPLTTHLFLYLCGFKKTKHYDTVP